MRPGFEQRAWKFRHGHLALTEVGLCSAAARRPAGGSHGSRRLAFRLSAFELKVGFLPVGRLSSPARLIFSTPAFSTLRDRRNLAILICYVLSHSPRSELSPAFAPGQPAVARPLENR